MTYEKETLGKLLSDERIAPVAADAIRNRDLRDEPVWNMTLGTISKERFFTGQIHKGIDRLYRAADTGEWYYPLYNEKECSEDHARDGVSVVWLPSDEAGADDRPFILIIPGGGFVNVWNLTEGWPVAEKFNRLGYHVFVLTYQVDGDRLFEKNMQDISRALVFIKNNEKRFHLDGDRYITCGFSAGGYLLCLWNTEKGYLCYDLPKPQASFPVYPVTGLCVEDPGDPEERENIRYMCGCEMEEALGSAYETTQHAEHFPPCAFFLAADDELVSPDNSKDLAAALEKHGIPCRLEIAPAGGHGFADGTGTDMAGWTERAVKWYESL